MAQGFPQVIGNWWLGECLGSGYSGSIFKAHNIHTGQIAALKLQLVDHECPTNRYERAFYPMLQGGEGMPVLYGSGVQGQYDYLVINLLGASLDSLYRKLSLKVMDLRSVCCIAMQVIRRLETMHTRGVLHRDIQLGNCVIGLPPDNTLIYMIDFGFSKVYIDPKTGEHLADRRHKRDFIGNYWFSSVAVHCKGRVPTRRDDMEALALMLIHLLTPGGLSWTRNGVPKTDAAHDILKREKSNATPEDLCRGLPSEYEEFLRYCRRLKFAERPDYDRWYAAFQDLAMDEGFPSDEAFVWPPPQPARYAHAVTKSKPAKGIPDVDALLRGLTNLDLKDRQALGRRDNNIARDPHVAKPAVKKLPGVSDERVVLDSTSADEGESQKRGVMRLTKATQLTQLTRRIRDATDNVALARVVREFTEVLDSSRSRTLTKEGFAFLDALYKQLADPSVFVMPMRTSRKQQQQENDVPEGDARRAKMNKMLRLRQEAAQAKNNKQLAQLVSEFGTTIDKSKSRSITKDSIAFLDILASTARELA
ncbi:CK1/CK1 protein kinase [Cytidiella melzeri]|nr:CK1/CK1 protein kinase [Cytidiella melzeri]